MLSLRRCTEYFPVNPHRFSPNPLLVAMVMRLICVPVVLLVLIVILRYAHKAKWHRQIVAHEILPEELHTLQSTRSKFLILDVRQPLDFLADAEIIPGAVRIAPKELIANPSSIPTDTETIVYCTCPGEDTSRIILQRALRLGYGRVKFLKGGIAAWKAKGYPVEPYNHPFHLDSAS